MIQKKLVLQQLLLQNKRQDGMKMGATYLILNTPIGNHHLVDLFPDVIPLEPFNMDSDLPEETLPGNTRKQ